jgi:hypothetical protein
MADGGRSGDRLGKILDTGFVTEIALAVSALAAARYFDRRHRNAGECHVQRPEADRQGVVIGIIDDGCRSRIRTSW